MEGDNTPGVARRGYGRDFPFCGILERIHDGPDHHPEPKTPAPARSNHQFYGVSARRMGSGDGVQCNCGHTGRDLVCFRPTQPHRRNDVWLYPVMLRL